MSAAEFMAIAAALALSGRRRIARPLTSEQVARRDADLARDEWNRAVEMKKSQKRDAK